MDWEVKVRDCWVTQSWVFSWRRLIRDGEETRQFESMQSLLSSVSLGVQTDKEGWNLDLSGVFTVKSNRKHIDEVRLQTGGRKTM